MIAYPNLIDSLIFGVSKVAYQTIDNSLEIPLVQNAPACKYIEQPFQQFLLYLVSPLSGIAINPV